MDAEQAMRRAIELSRRGLGRTSPNPVVGAVILDAAGHVVGEGWHRGAGQPHAEVEALAEAGAAAVGGTVVVTLEPCAHTGRTGPCTAALIAAGITRVVAAVSDPNPLATGGNAVLRTAGITVQLGLLAAEAREVNITWLTAVRRERPFVTWKFAATLDGRSAAVDGSSRWITGEPARADVHRLRSEVDAVIVGVGTVLADDPALTVRLPDYAAPQPLRVVVDSSGRTPVGARVLTDGAAPTWIASVEEFGADETGRVDLGALLHRLYTRDCRSVLLEGGPTLAAAALRAGLVDRVVAYLAPKLLGAGAGALAELGISSIGQALTMEVLDVARLGDDLRFVAEPRVTRAAIPALRDGRSGSVELTGEEVQGAMT